MWYGKIYYGAGNLGLSFVTQSLTGFIMFFGTAVAGIPGTLMGVAFAIGLVWDSVTDPMAGYISDKTDSTLLGRRHGYIISGTFLLAIANIFLWNLPINMSIFAKFIWMLFGILFFQTCATIIMTPYNALALDLSGDYDEQTELQGYKAIFFLLGIILPTVIMGFLQSNVADGLDGRYEVSTYRTLATIGSIFILLCGFTTFIGTYSHIPRLNKKARLKNADKKKIPLKQIMKNFFSLFKDENYRSIIIGSCAMNMASAFLTGIGMHVFTYSFKLSSTQMYLLIGEFFVVTILSQPIWLNICKKADKKPSLMGGLKLAAAGLVLLVLVFIFRGLIKNTSVLIAILTAPIVIVGMGMGSTYLIPQSMMADVIAYNSKKDEGDKTATIMGFMTFSFKISQALTLLIVGIMLDIIGFNSGADPAVYEPSLFVENALGYILSFGLVVGIGVAIYFISKYKLKKEDIPKIETYHIEVKEIQNIKKNPEVD